MEFLVRLDWEYPPNMTEQEIDELMAAEEQRGIELMDEGIIKHFWRLPGRRANVGVWVAEDAAALNAAIWSLPWFRWVQAEVTPLATHYLTREREQ